MEFGNGVTAFGYGPEDAKNIVYFIDPENHTELMKNLAEKYNLRIVHLANLNWDQMLTPWEAPGVFKKGGDFGNGADEFLMFIEEEVIPFAEGTRQYDERTLAGVSLAGLFTVYAGTRTDKFSHLISISGALWYDNFLSYMEGHPVNKKVKSVYLSLGDREKKARNPRMARVEERTQQIKEIIEKQGIRTTFELNPGNHFTDFEGRAEKAVKTLP